MVTVTRQQLTEIWEPSELQDSGLTAQFDKVHGWLWLALCMNDLIVLDSQTAEQLRTMIPSSEFPLTRQNLDTLIGA